jgi:guanylate kinase
VAVSKNRGAIIVISGPSGSGKTTLVKRVLADDPSLVYSVSATTRAPRPGEVDGRDYWFLTREEFRRRIEAGEFAEWAETFGNYYGTPAGPMREAVDEGRVFVLEIDVAGARQIRAKFPRAVFVFIRTPDFEVLAERLRGRRTETPEQFNTRLARAQEELAAAGEYQHAIVNNRLDDAIGELKDLIRRVKEDGRAEGN